MSTESNGYEDLLSLIDYHFDDELGFTELDALED
jgi:hypothetical protein